MGNHKYKCRKCRLDKKPCKPLTDADGTTRCQRCRGMFHHCDDFGFKHEHDDSGQADGTLSQFFPMIGNSEGDPTLFYSQPNLGPQSDNPRYVNDVSANESTSRPLQRLRQLCSRRISAAALNNADFTSFGNESDVVVLSILDHVVELEWRYRCLCSDNLREARQHYAPPMTKEDRDCYRSNFHSTMTTYETERVIEYIREQMHSQDATAFSISTIRSLDALIQRRRPGKSTIQAETAYTTMLSTCINVLLPSGNDDSHGQYCAALIAARFRWPKALQRLIGPYSGLHSCVDFLGRNIIHILIDTGQKKTLAKLLLSPQIEESIRVLANSADRQGLTPMDICAYKDQVGMFKMLLKHGEGISRLDSKGRRVLDLAVSAGSTAVVQACLRTPGFKDNMKDGMKSPLMDAIRLGNSSIVRMLIEDGAYPLWSRMRMSTVAQNQRIKEMLEEHESKLVQQGQIPPQNAEEVLLQFHQRFQEPDENSEEPDQYPEEPLQNLGEPFESFEELLQSTEAAQIEPQSPQVSEKSKRSFSQPPPMNPSPSRRVSPPTAE